MYDSKLLMESNLKLCLCPFPNSFLSPFLHSNRSPPRGVHGSEISIQLSLHWPGFEPQTSHLAVQHAPARPPRTLSGSISIMAELMTFDQKSSILSRYPS